MPPTMATGTGRAAAVISLALTTALRPGDRADRQVELAGDEQDRLADGDDADEGNDGEDRTDVAVREERRLDDVEEQHDHHEGGEHADLADREEPDDPVAERAETPLRCGCPLRRLPSFLPGSRLHGLLPRLSAQSALRVIGQRL